MKRRTYLRALAIGTIAMLATMTVTSPGARRALDRGAKKLGSAFFGIGVEDSTEHVTKTSARRAASERPINEHTIDAPSAAAPGRVGSESRVTTERSRSAGSSSPAKPEASTRAHEKLVDADGLGGGRFDGRRLLGASASEASSTSTRFANGDLGSATGRAPAGLPRGLDGKALDAAKQTSKLGASGVATGKSDLSSAASATTSGTAVGKEGAGRAPAGIADFSRVPFRTTGPDGANGSPGSAGVNGRDGSGDQTAAGARGAQKVVTEEITVSVFGPWGPEGPKKLVQTQLHTGLFEPQPHNPSRGIGVNEQIYRLVAGGREQPKTNPQPIALASGGTMNVDNWNVQVPHRPNIQLPGQAPVEYGTIPVYSPQAFAAGQDPNRLGFRVPTVSEPTPALFFCSIHPTEVRAQLLLLPADIEDRVQKAPGRRGPSHGQSALLRSFSFGGLLAETFRRLTRDAHASLFAGL